MSLSLPHAAEPLLSAFSIAFTRPTFQRAMVLLVGLILTVGRRTVTRTLWTARPLAVGALHRLPPLLLPRPLVLVAAGPGAGGDGVGTRPRGRTGAVPGRRHGRAAPGQTRLRQGSPPRRVPLEQRSHGLALGTPLGHPGDQRAARLRQQPPVGASGADRVVPPARAERAGGTAAAAAQDADRAGAAAHRHADAPGSPRVRSSCWATADSRLTSWRSSVTAIAGG
jgi:hypothetical protein